MEGIRDGGLIGSNGADLDAEFAVAWSSVAERRANEGEDVISTRDDEVADETFVSVDDEIAAPFLRFFVMRDELSRREAVQVAFDRLCDRVGKSIKKEEEADAP